MTRADMALAASAPAAKPTSVVEWTEERAIAALEKNLIFSA